MATPAEPVSAADAACARVKANESRTVAAECAPAEHSGQAFDPVAEADAVGVDPEREQSLLVFALAHLQNVEAASELGLDLDVPEEEHVVEDEGEAAEVCAAAERGHFVREDGRAAGGTHEAAERPHIRGEPSSLAGGECELGETVHHDALHVAAGELAAHDAADLVPVELDRRDMTHDQLIFVDALPVPAGRGRLLLDLSRTLLERDVEAPFSLLQARGEEAQRQQRLADAGGADDECRVAARNPASDRAVEVVEAERGACFEGRDAPRQRRLEPREALDAAAADPEAVLASRHFVAAHLQNPQPAP